MHFRAQALAGFCPPRPDVIQDDVAAVDYEAIRRAARCCAADTEEHIGKNRRIRGVIFAARITGPDLQQRGRGRWASIEENSRDHYSLGAGGAPHGYDSFLWNQSRETEAKHHRVWMHDLDRLIKLINARSEDQIFAGRQCGGDGRSAVGRTGDEETLDWDGRTRRSAASPARTRGIELDRRDEDVVVSAGIYVQVWRFSCYRTGCECRVGSTAWRMTGEALRGRAYDPRERLVPDAVCPAVELAVSDQPLLLRAIDNGAAVDIGIGNEAAARERWSCATGNPGAEAVNVDPAHRSGLRHGPKFAVVATEGRGV